MPQFSTPEEAKAAMRAASIALVIASDAYRELLLGSASAGHPAPERRQVESCILEAAPGPHETPVTLKQLAKRAGYSYSEWFRREVDALVVAGELVRTGKGVRRAGAV